MRITVFLACLSLALARPQSRIVGGSDAPAASRPYQVALLYSADGLDQFCSGALVHPKWVVTAGNCVTFKDVYVGLGFTDLRDTTGTRIIKGKWIQHPDFNYETLDHDLALIELDAEVPLSSIIRTVRIAKSGSDVSGKTKALLSGWGSTESDGKDRLHLQQAVMDILDREVCDYILLGETVSTNMICTESKNGKDFCWGDEGGPLVTNFSESSYDPSTTLVGLVSWGWDCADPNYPGIYNRVSNYCSWFAATTGNVVKC